MKILLCIFLLAGATAYSQEYQTPDICAQNMQQAREEVEAGLIVVTSPLWYGYSDHSRKREYLRYEKQLTALCHDCGLGFSYEIHSDFSPDQRSGCYGEYMDSVIASLYGNGFKEKLMQEADSLLSVSNDTIPYYDCDTRPFRVSAPEEIRLELELDSTVSRSFRTLPQEDPSVMYISFYLDKQDRASGYRMSLFDHVGPAIDNRVLDELYLQAVAALKQVNDWQTGTILGRKVITKTHAKVYFREKAGGQ